VQRYNIEVDTFFLFDLQNPNNETHRGDDNIYFNSLLEMENEVLAATI